MSLNIVVCIKQVPHPEHFSKIVLKPETKTIIREGIPAIVNPSDRNAIEEGLRIKERFSGKVTIITMGPPEAREALEEALAMGADEAVHLCDRAFAGADTLATAYTLSCAIQKLCPFDIILCGNETIDSGTSQVGPQIAEILHLPRVTQVEKIEFVEEKALIVKRALDYGHMKVKVGLPALLAVRKEINRPRLPTVAGIMEATKKEIRVCKLADLGIEEDRVGLAGSPTQVIDIIQFKSTRRREILKGSPPQVVKEAVKKLRELGAL